jgi:hypothetical protein
MPSTRRIYSDFRGLVKRGGIGIGFCCLLQSLERCAGRIVSPAADKNYAA